MSPRSGRFLVAAALLLPLVILATFVTSGNRYLDAGYLFWGIPAMASASGSSGGKLTAAVLGATGAVGKEVVAHLVERGNGER